MGINWSQALTRGGAAVGTMMEANAQGMELQYNQLRDANLMRFRKEEAEADIAFRKEEGAEERKVKREELETRGAEAEASRLSTEAYRTTQAEQHADSLAETRRANLAQEGQRGEEETRRRVDSVREGYNESIKGVRAEIKDLNKQLQASYDDEEKAALGTRLTELEGELTGLQTQQESEQYRAGLKDDQVSAYDYTERLGIGSNPKPDVAKEERTLSRRFVEMKPEQRQTVMDRSQELMKENPGLQERAAFLGAIDETVSGQKDFLPAPKGEAPAPAAAPATAPPPDELDPAAEGAAPAAPQGAAETPPETGDSAAEEPSQDDAALAAEIEETATRTVSVAASGNKIQAVKKLFDKIESEDHLKAVLNLTKLPKEKQSEIIGMYTEWATIAGNKAKAVAAMTTGVGEFLSKLAPAGQGGGADQVAGLRSK